MRRDWSGEAERGAGKTSRGLVMQGLGDKGEHFGLCP